MFPAFSIHAAFSLLNKALITKKLRKKKYLAMKMFTYENNHVDLTSIL